MLTLSTIEDACEAKGITLVMHPAVRRALAAYEESFYIGAACFLHDKTEGVYYLPLDQGYVRLAFSLRRSPSGRAILRIDPSGRDSLARIKAAVTNGSL